MLVQVYLQWKNFNVEKPPNKYMKIEERKRLQISIKKWMMMWWNIEKKINK